MQVLCWGVRDMKFFSVSSPIVEMHLEGEKITKTLQIENVSKNPNFPGPRPFITHDMVHTPCNTHTNIHTHTLPTTRSQTDTHPDKHTYIHTNTYTGVSE